MIHDKDYIIRIVRQFTNFLETMLLGKNEGDPIENQRVFDTQMRDVFKMSFEELRVLSSEKLLEIVEVKSPEQRAAYFDLLANLFFYKFKEKPDADLAQKSRLFFEKWIDERKIFSIPAMQKISELKEFADKQ